MSQELGESRRTFLVRGTVVGTGLFVAGRTLAGEPSDGKEEKAEEIPATEDLMREHGVLNRILLIYEEGLRRLAGKEDVPPELFHKPATLVRKFVEDYHEKLEEDFIFPEFEKRNQQAELVRILRGQHQAGRRLTHAVLRIAGGESYRKPEGQAELITSVRQFIRMYRPHEAREDTVLFPALRAIVPQARIDELGDQFEKREDQLFGDEGFEKTVEQVAAIEKQLGIYDLSQFTPQ